FYRLSVYIGGLRGERVDYVLMNECGVAQGQRVSAQFFVSVVLKHRFPSRRRRRDLPNQCVAKNRDRADYLLPPEYLPAEGRRASIRLNIRQSIVSRFRGRDTPDPQRDDQYILGGHRAR